MIFLILKIIMLALSYKLYLVKKDAFFSALLFSIPLAIAGVIMGYPLANVFIGSAILFALAFLCYWLLDKVPNGAPHYAVMGVTTAIVIFFL